MSTVTLVLGLPSMFRMMFHAVEFHAIELSLTLLMTRVTLSNPAALPTIMILPPRPPSATSEP